MSKIMYKILVIALSLMSVYVLFLVTAPLFLDGNLLDIKSPSGITKINSETVQIEMEINSNIHVSEAEMTYSLWCDNGRLYQYTDRLIGVSKGEIVKVFTEDVGGIFADNLECRFQGSLSYNVHGPLTPRLHIDFYTEQFRIEQICSSSLD